MQLSPVYQIHNNKMSEIININSSEDNKPDKRRANNKWIKGKILNLKNLKFKFFSKHEYELEGKGEETPRLLAINKAHRALKKQNEQLDNDS